MSQVVVIFEAIIEPDNVGPFMETAGGIIEKLKSMDGFISVENYKSLVEENKFINLSFWRDEAAVEAWRNTMEHRGAQKKGHDFVFSGFRLRVGEVVRDYTDSERGGAPGDSNEYFGK